MAGACCAETKSAGVHASKKNRTKRFTVILPREIPCEDIESQVADKVSANCFRDCLLGPPAREIS
jgi:hypothetical protein